MEKSYTRVMSLHLRKMSQSEFDRYLAGAIPKYAAEKMKGEGLSPDLAQKVSEESFKTLLPKGLFSENQFLFSIVDSISDGQVGILWYAQKKLGNKTQAYIYDIEIDEAFRGRGFGKESLRLLEVEVKKCGIDSIGLHVFGHNKTAKTLYEKLGYRATNIVMVKDV